MAEPKEKVKIPDLPIKGKELKGLHERLVVSNKNFADDYPGDPTTLYPHMFYIPSKFYKAGANAKMSSTALKGLLNIFEGPKHFGQIFGIERIYRKRIWLAVKRMLESNNAVKAATIDYEDGLGPCSNEKEDELAVKMAMQAAKDFKDGTAPEKLGFRVRSLTEECRERSIRTLQIFLTTLYNEYGSIPEGFFANLPKATSVEQVEVFNDALNMIEEGLNIEEGTIKIDLMFETPQSLIQNCGITVHDLIEACGERINSMAFGTYDHTSLLQIAPDEQTHTHPDADWARAFIKHALAQTGILLVDGATTKMPIPLHKSKKKLDDGTVEVIVLTAKQEMENEENIENKLRLHFDNVMHSLYHGWWASWDLNPTQLIARYAALFYFFVRTLPKTQERLKKFVESGAEASMTSGASFDDEATAKSLLAVFRVGLALGVYTVADLEETGLIESDLDFTFFQDIIEQVNERKAKDN